MHGRIRAEHAPSATVLGLHDNQDSKNDTEDDLGDKDYSSQSTQRFRFLQLDQLISIASTPQDKQIG